MICLKEYFYSELSLNFFYIHSLNSFLFCPKYKKKLGRITQKPKAPKPFELYSQAKLPQLMEQGLTGLQARQMCHQNYKCLDTKKKLKWINRALKKESAYLVIIIASLGNK